MPFEKNDEQTREWSRQGVEARRAQREGIWAFLANRGPEEYEELLERLKTEELKPNEREWMDRVERLFPFVKSKPTQSHDLTSGGKVISGFQIIDATTNPSTHGEPIPDTASPPIGTETEN